MGIHLHRFFLPVVAGLEFDLDHNAQQLGGTTRKYDDITCIADGPSMVDLDRDRLLRLQVDSQRRNSSV